MGLLKKTVPLVLLAFVLIISYCKSKHGSENSTRSVDQTKNMSHKTLNSPTGMSAAKVIVDSVKIKKFDEKLNVIGNGRAIATVGLTPWSAGVVDKLFVSAGEKVQAGDLIAKLDSKKEEIAAARAKVQRDNSALTLSRILKLRATNTATEVQELTARLELDNANLVLRDAELALDRRTIRTPISGIVGILPIDVGNAVAINTEIGRIENRERILIDIWVPERYASRISKGDEVAVTLATQSSETFVGHIYAIDNIVDVASRTFHVQVEIENEKDTLMSGMSFSVTFQFDSGLFPVVNPLAVQWDSNGSFVWCVKENKVERIPVSIVKHKTDQVFVKAFLENDTQVVIQGVQVLYPGRNVIIEDSKGPQQ
ncbi:MULTISPECIES: efflux RND transporter periplasmic adaptor subunit [unclassified Bartonella]|uniref:efflux RND transporter periplasmic adaptor subunit n=1 Tax=unclassified Bartonella TaxID=2645622 RepID=UPI000999914C|nr:MULTISPECIES: efflux RND transporter periplasmic adaptor subunit [unclassified Bartonella]AQX27536.1 RND family efflux transporter, MFP subunit [Bartonella sp. JB15]AQX28816.1 RND family efflux transporter, MFP subunit [Bartonella sp. JB63]